jgi:hypothetical protein
MALFERCPKRESALANWANDEMRERLASSQEESHEKIDYSSDDASGVRVCTHGRSLGAIGTRPRNDASTNGHSSG